MSNQVKRSTVNALVVELMIERNNLQKAVKETCRELGEIGELRFRLEKNQENTARLNDEIWALKDTIRSLSDRLRANGDPGLQLQWYQTFRDVMGYRDLQPFGVKDDVLVDPMDGDKIPTIKLVRELTGLGLKEAKDIVDKWEADGRFRKFNAKEL